MAYRTTLAELAKAPCTARELAERLNMETTSVSSELLSLWARRQVTREKLPRGNGRPAYVYSVAAAPPAS